MKYYQVKNSSSRSLQLIGASHVSLFFAVDPLECGSRSCLWLTCAFFLHFISGKKVQPVFEGLAAQYCAESKDTIAFVIVDVDDHDEIANQFNIAMMPTFLVLEKGGNLKATYRGSNGNELQAFLKENVK